MKINLETLKKGNIVEVREGSIYYVNDILINDILINDKKRPFTLFLKSKKSGAVYRWSYYYDGSISQFYKPYPLDIVGIYETESHPIRADIWDDQYTWASAENIGSIEAENMEIKTKDIVSGEVMPPCLIGKGNVQFIRDKDGLCKVIWTKLSK